MTTPMADHAATLAEVAMDTHNGDLLTIIPHDHDVLCGRGGLTNHHKGNTWYRRLVSCNRPLYRSSPKHTKLLVSKAIVQAVHSQSPPGRFLERHKTTGLWHPVPYKRAVDKTSQALREKERVVDEQDEGVLIPPVKVPSSEAALDQASSLHDLARAAVERAGGMPDYSVQATAASAPPAAAAVPPAAAVPSPPMPPVRTPSVSDTMKSHMATYAVQALQSAGGIPKNWGYPFPGLQPPNPAAAASMAAAAAAAAQMNNMNAFAAPAPLSMPPMLPPVSIPPPLPLQQQPQQQPPRLISNSPPPAAMASKPPPKRPRENSSGSTKLARNHRKLPTKKRRVAQDQQQEQEPVPLPPEPLQDRDSSMFRFFQENQLLTEDAESSGSKSPSAPASLSSSTSGEDDTPLTMLMQVATSELVEKGNTKDKKKSNVAMQATQNGSDAAMDASAPAPALSHVKSQVSDWLKTSFFPVPPHLEAAASGAASVPPQLAPGVSSTLLKLAPSRLLSGFSSFFDRNHQVMPQQQSPPPKQQQHGKSTGKSLLDDYEESAMEAQLRTVPSNMVSSSD